ncbi:MAG: imidazole glycerol phosphate synthase subunit HisH [Alphaproteobacteria bacterium]
MSVVAIIDYGSGNLRSAAKAFERAANTAKRAHRVVLTADRETVTQSDRVVLPGVGAFADCVKGLDAVEGMTDALREVVIVKGRPFLGICVGMQLMAHRGLEHGETPGLGWIDGDVVAIDSMGGTLKIPHMGWNELAITNGGHAVLRDIPSGTHAYFVHGYHLDVRDPHQVLATVDYGHALAAIVGRDNMVGTQFHPEKSQGAGLRLIANFLAWQP